MTEQTEECKTCSEFEAWSAKARPVVWMIWTQWLDGRIELNAICTTEERANIYIRAFTKKIKEGDLYGTEKDLRKIWKEERERNPKSLT